MKNFLVNDLVKEMNEGKLELVDLDTLKLTEHIVAYMSFADVKYRKSDADDELRKAIESYNNKINDMITKIVDIQTTAIKFDQPYLIFTCEDRKRELTNLGLYLQNKYLEE